MTLRRAVAMLAGALAVTGVMAGSAVAQRFDDRPPPDRRFEDRGGARFDDRRYREREWLLLGEKDVGFGVDRDVISVNQSEDWNRTRKFRTLHIVATGNEIHLINVRLVYLNGFREDLPFDSLVHPGQDVPLDLRGERSYLRRIEMTYRARPDFRGRAVMRVYGEPSRFGGPPPGPGPASVSGRYDPPPPVRGGRDAWVELGCHQVALVGKDRDSIPVGRREGRFKAIRLHVRGADVELRDLRVIYGNGEPDDLQVRRLIRAGEFTRPLDLKGWERVIDRVDMTFKTVLNPVDIIAKQRLTTATVCVEGLQ